MTETLYESHSANVEIWLDTEHGRIDLCRVSPKSVVATSTQDIPPCHADLVAMIDGQVTRVRVLLVSGFRNRRMARVFAVDDSVPF